MTFRRVTLLYFFFFNDTATTEIYTLSLHDALPICGAIGRRLDHVPVRGGRERAAGEQLEDARDVVLEFAVAALERRSEEHTSELQSQSNLVCRLLLEKKKKKTI